MDKGSRGRECARGMLTASSASVVGSSTVFRHGI